MRMKLKNNIIELFQRYSNNKYKIYYNSFNSIGGNYLFLIKDLVKKYIIIVSDLDFIKKFEGKYIFSKRIDQKK